MCKLRCEACTHALENVKDSRNIIPRGHVDSTKAARISACAVGLEESFSFALY
jgi:hypothetical protein